MSIFQCVEGPGLGNGIGRLLVRPGRGQEGVKLA